MSGSDHWVTSCGFALCRLAGAILSTYRNFLSYCSLKGCPWLPLKFKLLYFLTHTTFLFISVSAPACPCYMPRLSSWQLLSFLSFLRPAVLEKIAKLVCGLVKLTLYKEVFILYFNKYSLPTKSGIPLELHLVGRFLQRKEHWWERLLKITQSLNYNGSGFLLFPNLVLQLWTSCLHTRVTISAEPLRFSSKWLSQ